LNLRPSGYEPADRLFVRKRVGLVIEDALGEGCLGEKLTEMDLGNLVLPLEQEFDVRRTEHDLKPPRVEPEHRACDGGVRGGLSPALSRR
jgi:hypothetical protein